jgi:CRP-like cAMP-binding protein
MRKFDGPSTEDLQSLRLNLLSFAEIPETEWAFFASILKSFQLEKDEYFFREGDLCAQIGFLQSGLLCSYYTDDKGFDYVKSFSLRPAVVAGFTQLLLDSPSIDSCRALESSRLFVLEREDLQGLYRRHVCWEKLGRRIFESLFIEKDLRERDLLIHDARTRYFHFQRRFPQLTNRIPQYLIASYIAITPESLSRIKREEAVLLTAPF